MGAHKGLLRSAVPFEEGLVHKPGYTGIKIDPLECLTFPLTFFPTSCFFSVEKNRAVEGK